MNLAIILNYNDYETTTKCLTSIKHYKSIHKIVVVDNCSTDCSYEKLSLFADNKIDVIKTKKNGGYASGNNFGIRYAEERYKPLNIIISNPDIEISDSTINNICKYLNESPNVAAATGVICNSQGQLVKNFAWKLPEYSDTLIGTSLVLNKISEKLYKKSMLYSKDELHLSKYMQVDVLPGCFFVIKDSVLRAINYFDEDTFLFCEENILAFKLRSKSYKSYILTDEKLIHNHSITVNKNIKSWNKKADIKKESYLIYLNKYLKVTKTKKLMYQLLYNIGKCEKYVYEKIKK